MSDQLSSVPSTVGRPTREVCLRRGAKALVRSSNRVLLVKERHSDGSPFWTLPGGGVHPEESLVEGLHRELAEELDCHGVVRAPVGTFQYAHQGRPDTFSVYTVFETSIISEPTPNIREGVLDCQWVDLTSAPAETLPQVMQFVQSVVG